MIFTNINWYRTAIQLFNAFKNIKGYQQCIRKMNLAQGATNDSYSNIILKMNLISQTVN